jgi:hypothetical protein
MKRLRLLIPVITLMALTYTEPVRADTDVTHFKLNSASATFSSVDGCVTTTVTIGANEGYHSITSQLPREVLSSASLTAFRWNTCTGETLLDLAGDVPLPVNGFSGSRRSARLQATIDVYERVSDSFFDVLVDMRWTSAGELIVVREHLQDIPGCILNNHRVSTTVPAQATGSIQVFGINVTPAPTTDALVQTAQETLVGQDCQEPG